MNNACKVFNSPLAIGSLATPRPSQSANVQLKDKFFKVGKCVCLKN